MSLAIHFNDLLWIFYCTVTNLIQKMNDTMKCEKMEFEFEVHLNFWLQKCHPTPNCYLYSFIMITFQYPINKSETLAS